MRKIKTLFSLFYAEQSFTYSTKALVKESYKIE